MKTQSTFFRVLVIPTLIGASVIFFMKSAVITNYANANFNEAVKLFENSSISSNYQR
jgi:hypothetical protein